MQQDQELRLRGLRNLRRREGLSQEELGRRVGVGQDAISNYERGSRTPHPRTMKKLAEALGVSIPDLLRDQPLTAPKAKAPATDHLARMLVDRGGSEIWLRSADELREEAATPFDLRTIVRQLAKTQRIARKMIAEPGLERGERKALQHHARQYQRKLATLSVRGAILLKQEEQQLEEDLEAAMEVGQRA